MEKRDVIEDFRSLPVGRTFEWCKLIFEVRESSSCKGCWFLDAESGCTSSLIDRSVPCCGGSSRKDGKDVIFVQVNEVQD